MLHKQLPSSLVIIPIITHNSKILYIFTENPHSSSLITSPFCSWKSIELCHSLHTYITAIVHIVLNSGHKLTCQVWCMCPPIVQCMCWFVFDPIYVAVNELNSGWSSTSCGTPNLHTKLWYHNDLNYASLTLLSTDWCCNGHQQAGNSAYATDTVAEACKVSVQGGVLKFSIVTRNMEVLFEGIVGPQTLC